MIVAIAGATQLQWNNFQKLTSADPLVFFQN
jgi:hypothetical protein